MHHLYPLVKGDALCPLGFHPQVRWPTRCKRCFRDYKEHGGKKRDDDLSLRRDDSTSSTPSLNSWGPGRSDDHRRSWSSSTNLAQEKEHRKNATTAANNADFNSPASWTSTPDLANLEDTTQASIPTVRISLPKRKSIPVDKHHRTVSDSFSTSSNEKASKGDSLAARARKLQAAKDSSQERANKRIQIKEVRASVDENTNHDVQFLIQVKSKSNKEEKKRDSSGERSDFSDDDVVSLAGTDTTDTTLVGDRHSLELQEQIDGMRKELDAMKTKCDRLEREKSDLLLRRLAAMETTTSKTTATEVLKLQQKCNDLQVQLEDLRDDKKSLSLKVRELDGELETRPTAQAAQKVADELKSKLLAAETLCEELMDENEDMRKELRDMEDEIEEMQDNFREDQADEYSSLKKELEQTTKNCRILSFKLRKTERKVEQLETEKTETESKMREASGSQNLLDKIKNLEQELKSSNELSTNLQKELEKTVNKLNKAEESNTKKKTPMLGSIPKVPSAEGKVSRESLTRGGSQEDPQQLLRDLQDSLEREADLREQLKFAEEEAQNLRKKASRIEDDNESLVLQLKKMATKARSRKASPNRLTPEPEKDEGISEDDDPAELRLLLELNEQEASVLRKKVEEIEGEKEVLKRKVKDLQEKLAAKTTTKKAFLGIKSNSTQDQKLKVLEDEANALKKRLQEREKETERLQSELTLTQKRSKGMQKSQSLDLDQQTLDLKRQLQVIEQEALVLRTKVQALEADNDKLNSENKKLQLLRNTKTAKSDKSLDKYINQIADLELELSSAKKKIEELQRTSAGRNGVGDEQLKHELSKAESERDKLLNALNKLKEESLQSFKNRTPKKPSEFTSKVQLKNMVIDLENEIGEMMVAMKNYENSKLKLEEDLKQAMCNSKNVDSKQSDKLNDKVKLLEKDLAQEQRNLVVEKSKHEELERTLSKAKENVSRLAEDKKQLVADAEKAKEQCEKLIKDRMQYEEEITKLKEDLKKTLSKQEEFISYKQKSDSLRIDLDKRDAELSILRKDLEEKTKSVKDLNLKAKKIPELERKAQEAEDKVRKVEKTSKEQCKILESKLEEEKDSKREKDLQQSELSVKWSADRKVLNLQIDELNSKIKSLESIILSKNRLIEQLEESLRKERESSSSTKQSSNDSEMNKLRDELNKNKVTLTEVESKLEITNKSKKMSDEKLKKLENDFKKEKLALEKKSGGLEIDLQNERKKIEVMKVNHEKENKNKETELSSLRNKMRTLEMSAGSGSKKVSEVKQEYQERIDKLEAALASEKREYDDLTGKYEILEEEHVITKAKLVMEKESLHSQYLSVRSELDNLENELQALKDSNSADNDKWTEKELEFKERIQKLEKGLRNGDNFELSRWKASLAEKTSELEQIRKEYDVVHDQMEYMRRESDELRKKLDDYDKVSKIQRNISADSSAMEKEIRQMKNRLTHAEKQRKSDLTECKMRYDNQVSLINDELRSLQGQVTRFKRERDTYKHMLEGAQKTIGDLKSSPSSRRDSRVSIASFDEIEESKNKVATLEQQISCMEDELSEARLEASKLKTELVSERSSWEIKLSELHSRVNELEEERILSSGRTKIPGLRTRMELAWQKEREEQQRLLQETSTLARDLRQTLFEVERERDKERLETKRKHEQLKKGLEEEQDENKKKSTELQCDLLELRDAHAKLRTTNEKLRREKERQDRDLQDMKAFVNGRKRMELEDDRRTNALLEQVDMLIKLVPESPSASKDTDVQYTPTPPRRVKGPKSRESSPALEVSREGSKEPSVSREDRKPQIHSIMKKLNDAIGELRRHQQFSEEDRERERIRRTMGLRRATSSEHENIAEVARASKGYVRNGTGNSLHRRSLSLEHTTIQQEQSIWRNDDSMSSLTSIEAASDVDTRWSKRDTSLDSRLSGGSTQSEAAGGERKKKKGLMGKLKKLTKSKSIDDQEPTSFAPLSSKHNSNSDIEEGKGSKRDLRDRLTGMFKRGGSSSRSNSLERPREQVKQDSSSTQRPLMPNGSNPNVLRASPAVSKR